jgi:hypothetical protein
MVFYFSLTLNPDREKEIIDELMSTPMGSVAAKIREMLRNGTLTDRFKLEDGDSVNVEVDMGEMSVSV